MKKLLATLSIFITTIAITQLPKQALCNEITHNNIAATIGNGSGKSNFGINSKIGISDNISVRPFITLPSGGATFGSSVSYDWNIPQSPTSSIAPFIGLGIESEGDGVTRLTTGFAQVGADLNISEQFVLVGSITIPFDRSNGSGNLTVGGGLRF